MITTAETVLMRMIIHRVHGEITMMIIIIVHHHAKKEEEKDKITILLGFRVHNKIPRKRGFV